MTKSQWNKVCYFVIAQSLGAIGFLFGNVHIAPFMLLLSLFLFPGLFVFAIFPDLGRPNDSIVMQLAALAFAILINAFVWWVLSWVASSKRQTTPTGG